MYADQKLLIDKTYQLAAGTPFSIATLTNPYGVNVTWAYLYDYLGNQNYGYEPTYFGFDQTGWVGADLLRRVEQPENKHFAIVEPDTGLNDVFIKKFMEEQQAFAGTPSASYKFGSLELLEY